MPSVAIIGLGYVGLPLALQFARSGIKTVGIDIDTSKIDRLKSGENYIPHLAAEDLGELVRSGQLDADTDPAREKALERLHKKAKTGIARVLANYEELLPATETFQIELGIENREGVFELPIDANFSDFFEQLTCSDRIGYWHDTGHAQIKDRLGLLDHRLHLEKLSDRLIGFHLHDVNAEGHDHQVPGTGSVDFGMVSEFIRPHHTLVAELSPRLSPDEVATSRDFLLEKLA